jgi:DNA-binding winged helix-turn-helix (wHTH) protein/TolB-like protein/Tfp pilus assembly protein PilF
LNYFEFLWEPFMQPIKLEDEGVYLFDAFRLDPARRLLEKEGETVSLTPKTFDTLVVLVRNCGRVMEKDELMQAIWPDTVVEESNLAHNISALRRIFGQKGVENRFIATVPGRGYSFVAPVQQEPPPLPAQPTNPGTLRLQYEVTRSRLTIEDESGTIGDALQTHQPFVNHADTTPVRVDKMPERTPLAAPPRTLARRLLRRAAIATSVLVGLTIVAYLVSFRSAPVKPIQSIAVLPFKPLVPDHRDEALEMGIADTLVTRLTSLNNLTVRPISAARRFTSLDQDPAAAGRDLQVQAVLEGSIQKADNKIRITARLINVADGKPIWTRQFDQPWTDIFAVQDAIAQRVAADLFGTLSGEEQSDLARNYTTDPEAYRLYLLGRYHWNKRSSEGMYKSIEYFRQVIEKDPGYALAYVGLADAYTTLGSYHVAPPKEVLPKAKEAALRALEIDERLAEAHATMGKISNDYDWDWERSEREFRRAIELKPNYPNAHHWYSTLLVTVGRYDEAVSEANRALELNPLSAGDITQMGNILYRARRYDQAIAVLQKSVELEPNFSTTYYHLGICYVLQGRYEEALAEFQRGRAISPSAPDFVAMLGYTCGLAGRRDEALRYQAELSELSKRRYVSPFNHAAIHSGLGEMDDVFKWLEKCYEERDPAIRALKTDPLFDIVRKDGRFAGLLRRVGME